MDLNDNARLDSVVTGVYCCDDEEDCLCGKTTIEKCTYFDLIVGHLEDILIDKHFQKLQHDFFDKYCLEFEEVEENKLSYMEIFGEYVSTIERNIEERLKSNVPNFDMETFLTEIRDNKQYLDGEVFEMLYTLSDFMAFKSLMLDYRAEKQGKNEDFVGTLTVVPLKI